MTCDRHDQDLLLFAHGELSAWRRFVVQTHLRRCPACRERHGRFRQVSAALADATRSPSSPAWSPARNHPSRKIFSLSGTRLLLIMAAFMAVVATWLAFHVVVNRLNPHGNIARHVPSGKPNGCAPNLPSDQCR